MDFYKLIETGKRKCLKDSPAPCSYACPLGIDVRDFINKFCSGLISAAYKAFSLHAVLPGIVCHICQEPCKDYCVRKDVDEAVSLKELEYYCWQQVHQQPKKSYYIREKKERILIYGSEVSELVAAVKLARRGYPVDLAVKGEQLGGALWNIDEKILPASVLKEDLQEIILEKYIHFLWHTAEIAPERMLEYDAVLLPGKNDKLSDELCNDNRIFRIEHSDSPLENIQLGSRLSYQIEEYVKVNKVFMTKESNRVEPYIPDLAGIQKNERVRPRDKDFWTYEEALSEAERCMQCQCSLCTDVCPMMQHYHEDYKQLASAVLDTVEAQEIDRKRGLYPLMSCLQCGACEQACPVDIDTGKLCLLSRRLIHKKKTLPDAHYHFWLSDMAQANQDAEFMIPAEEESRYVYFPGCQMGASYPEYVDCSYDWLRACYPGKVALWNRCCGAPADWSGNEVLHEQETEVIWKEWNKMGQPTFILSCPTCMEQFAEHFQEIEVISLWSLLSDHMEKKKPNGSKIAIFDSCAARKNKQLQQDIRTIVASAGYHAIELYKNKDNAQCCGYGGLVYSTNPQLVKEVIDRNSGQDTCEFVTYCTNCMDSFRLNHKKARFIFDLVFEIKPQQKVPDLTQRRQNRTKLKHCLQKKYLDLEWMEDRMPYQNIRLKMDEEMKRSINKQLLLEDDIKAVIGYAEENSVYLYNADTDERISHREIGYITIWVKYKTSEDHTYELCSVYFHRLKLKGAQDGGK